MYDASALWLYSSHGFGFCANLHKPKPCCRKFRLESSRMLSTFSVTAHTEIEQVCTALTDVTPGPTNFGVCEKDGLHDLAHFDTLHSALHVYTASEIRCSLRYFDCKASASSRDVASAVDRCSTTCSNTKLQESQDILQMH